MAVFIVVARKQQPVTTGRKGVVMKIKNFIKAVYPGFKTGVSFHFMQPAPGIAYIKHFVVIGFLAFRQRNPSMSQVFTQKVMASIIARSISRFV